MTLKGWHPNPYIAREFHGVWGDYDVKITIDKNYILGGTGYLQNSNEIGYGYQSKNKTVDHSKKEPLHGIFTLLMSMILPGQLILIFIMTWLGGQMKLNYIFYIRPTLKLEEITAS